MSISSQDVCLVLTTTPSQAVANTLANGLVNSGLAACVTQQAGVKSTYIWQGKLCNEEEVALIIKTTNKAYKAVVSYIQQEHPYDCPEVLKILVSGGSEAYLSWIRQAVVD